MYISAYVANIIISSFIFFLLSTKLNLALAQIRNTFLKITHMYVCLHHTYLQKCITTKRRPYIDNHLHTCTYKYMCRISYTFLMSDIYEHIDIYTQYNSY